SELRYRGRTSRKRYRNRKGSEVYTGHRKTQQKREMSLQSHLYHKIVPFCSGYFSAYEIGRSYPGGRPVQYMIIRDHSQTLIDRSTPIDNLLSILVCLP